MPAPLAAPTDPSVSYSSITAPVTPANVSRKIGLRNILGMSGMNLLYRDTHLLHDINTVFKREHDPFLCGTNNMLLSMQVKINSTYRASCLFIFQHTLRPVAKRKNTYSGTADRSLCRQPVHITVRNTFGSHITFHPRIQYTGTIDTQQHSQTGLLGSMIYMGKSIHPGFRIIIYLTFTPYTTPDVPAVEESLPDSNTLSDKALLGSVSGAIGYRNSLFQAPILWQPMHLHAPARQKSV